MKNLFKNLSIQMKVAIISTPIIVIAVVVGIFVFNKLENREVKTVGANAKNLTIEEEIVPAVKEEVIQVSQDNSIDDSLLGDEENEEKELEIAGKKVAVPKSKVAPVNSAEDPERNKKKGGASMTQDQASQLFENVGAKSSGIDVSAHQGKIDWAAVKADGVDFAMIRCGFRGYGSGAICEDAYFKTNVANATANGIKVGIYFYSAAINEQEAQEEAVWVISKIKTYRITYPVVYDFEDFQRYRCANVDGAQATRNAHAFLSMVQQAGYEPMMYASKNDISNRMSRGAFSCKFWLAHYTSGGLATPTDYSGNYNMWQYTSKGTVKGINGNVDMNIAYFSYGETAAPKHTHAFTELVRNSVKDATCFKEGSKTMRCSCGDTQNEVIPKLEHKYGEWTVTKEATETEEGLKVRKCQTKGCTAEQTEKIAKLKPNTNTNINTNTNTENKVGNNTVDNTVVEPPKHEHKWIQDSSKTNIEPTCTEAGKKFLKCEGCTETKEEPIPAKGHIPGEWKIDTPATETEEGKQHKECTVCGETVETETIPKLPPTTKPEEQETPVSE